MAGGEGTRLRPLTSNQPKPMVPIVGKPCMEHIIELLRRHGMDDIVVTVAYLPQVIRGYFGDGESLGVTLHYSVEETPLGTAGSVKNAEALLDETFLVISGDALCDFDLTAIIESHRARGAVATIALKSVENPLEFGVVIMDEDGRIERFLEKPSWGQVFSDTINTGVYVLEPEVLRAVPEGEPYDFSKQLFPDLLARGKPLYGYVAEGYWLDIGNLDQYRQANFDALDGRAKLRLPGIRLRENVYLGDGVQLPEVGQIDGPAYVGNYAKIEPGARIGEHSILGNNTVVKDGATIVRSVIDSGAYLGRSARVEGAILGKGVDVREHAVINDGVAIGDECSIGAESVIAPGVKVYPFKTIEAGANINSNLIWESRGITTLFGRDDVSGLVNVDITPDVATRLAMAYGTTLARGARVVASRDAHPASRMIKRAMLSGLVSTGINVSDLRVSMPAVNRHQLKIDERAGGLHVNVSADDPELLQITFFEAPGILVSDATLKSIERAYSRQEFRRVSAGEIGRLSYPSRATESYAQDLLETLDVETIRSRGFRVVLNFAYSPASLVVPAMIGELGVELISVNAFVDPGPQLMPTHEQSLDETSRLVRAVGADVGILMDVAAERIWLVDEEGRPIDAETSLLLLLRELSQQAGTGSLLVPITETHQVEEVVNGSDGRLSRTKASLHALLSAATEDGVLFAGASGGGYVFPDFLAAYDALASTGKVLEILARAGRPLSELTAGLPRSTLIHREVACPWSMKGTVMRRLIEELKGMDTDHTDGIKVFEEDGWAQMLPDPDEPVVHIYAEGATRQDSTRLEAKYRAMLDAILSADPVETLN
ncbi:MAG: mannose-phosphate guanylyltransferase / phosphomannomutase [Gaiellales bacterium]|jgi:mannose-1-phosphate guanylyltransferase/phosphomannomutase|nr:mannose-phosphate guanylyltransferase / phosphomannomutase [Gaiellales bacterium]